MAASSGSAKPTLGEIKRRNTSSRNGSRNAMGSRDAMSSQKSMGSPSKNPSKQPSAKTLPLPDIEHTIHGIDEHHKFEFEGEKLKKPWRLQGDERYEMAEVLQQRAQLRGSARLRASVEKFWRVFGLELHETLTKAEYVFLHGLIASAIAPELSTEEAAASAEDDWNEDLQGEKQMSFDLFVDGLFGIADLWTDSVCEIKYVNFLLLLFRRITQVSSAIREKTRMRVWRERHQVEPLVEVAKTRRARKGHLIDDNRGDDKGAVPAAEDVPGVSAFKPPMIPRVSFSLRYRGSSGWIGADDADLKRISLSEAPRPDEANHNTTTLTKADGSEITVPSAVARSFATGEQNRRNIRRASNELIGAAEPSHPPLNSLLNPNPTHLATRPSFPPRLPSLAVAHVPFNAPANASAAETAPSPFARRRSSLATHHSLLMHRASGSRDANRDAAAAAGAAASAELKPPQRPPSRPMPEHRGFAKKEVLQVMRLGETPQAGMQRWIQRSKVLLSKSPQDRAAFIAATMPSWKQQILKDMHSEEALEALRMRTKQRAAARSSAHHDPGVPQPLASRTALPVPSLQKPCGWQMGGARQGGAVPKPPSLLGAGSSFYCVPLPHEKRAHSQQGPRPSPSLLKKGSSVYCVSPGAKRVHSRGMFANLHVAEL